MTLEKLEMVNKSFANRLFKNFKVNEGKSSIVYEGNIDLDEDGKICNSTKHVTLRVYNHFFVVDVFFYRNDKVATIQFHEITLDDKQFLTSSFSGDKKLIDLLVKMMEDKNSAILKFKSHEM